MSQRLVTATCVCGRPHGFYVDADKRGTASGTCQCGATFEVRLDPAERPTRPGTHPEALRVHLADTLVVLETLEREITAYLKTRDLEVEELPDGSPLRAAVHRARRVVRSAPR